MIYLFLGNDTKNKLNTHQKFVKSNSSGIDVVSISRNDFNPMQIESLYSSNSLFSNKSMILFSNILDYMDERDFILSKLSMLSESDNVFVFLEDKMSKPTFDLFKKVKANIETFELPKIKTERFDNFLIANAFANKDRLNVWIYFRQAVDRGVIMEELSGVLFWKMKDLLLKKNFSKFKEVELKKYIARLSYLLPEARKEGMDAESVFEKFLLEAF